MKRGTNSPEQAKRLARRSAPQVVLGTLDTRTRVLICKVNFGFHPKQSDVLSAAAGATQVDVRLGREDGNIVLEVRDNGRGIGEAQLSTGRSLGILGMRERALLLGGELTIRGAPGKGTIVRVLIPETGR